MLFEKVYQELMEFYLLEHVIDEVPRKDIGMSTSIVDLPDKRPYGFWVDRSGNFLVVDQYGHERGGEDVLKRAKLLLNDKGIKYNPKFVYHELYGMGWARVVMFPGSVRFVLNPGERPTSPQLKFFNILKDMYGAERIVNDTISKI